MSSDFTDPALNWSWAQMEPEPSEEERNILDRFCVEFLVDGDATRAASRVGFQAGFAAQYGKLFYQKAYVQKKLRAMREASPPDKKTEEDYLRRLTIRRLSDVLNSPYSKGSDVVRAGAQLGILFGWNTPQARIPEGSGQAQGVILVPIGTMEDWEAAAAASQQKLIEASRVE